MINDGVSSSCTCPGFTYRGSCKHTTALTFKKRKTKEEHFKEKADLKKLDKNLHLGEMAKTSRELHDEKVKNDPELAEFLKKVS